MGQETNENLANPSEDFVRASVLVVSPGDNIVSQLGHACLRLQCPTKQLDYVFSNESENINDNVFRFLLGDLKMATKAVPTNEYLNQYKAEGRGVKEYALNLPIEVKQRLWQQMDERLEQSELPYDYMNSGCAVSVLEWLETAIGHGNISYGTWPAKYERSRKEIGGDSIKNEWCHFLLSLVIDGEANNVDLDNAKKVVVPSEFAEVLQNAKAFNKALVQNQPKILVNKNKELNLPWFTPLYCAILFVCLALINLKLKYKAIDILVLMPSFVLGVFVWFLVCCSKLPCTQWNVYMIPFNPIVFLLWKWKKYWIYPFVAVCTIWILFLLVYPHQIVDAAHIIYVLSTMITYIKFKKILKHEKN